MEEKSKFTIYLGWAIVNGLILGILISHGQDISETGIASMILKALNEAIPMPGYLGFQILFWIIGIGLPIIQAFIIWSEGRMTQIMGISGFLGMLFLILGTAISFLSFLQYLGIILFLVAIGMERYLVSNEK
jgi:hypothetical protein